MKKTILNMIMFLLCIHIFTQCAIVDLIVNSEYIENERDECSKWDNSSVLAVLYNEPAYIQKGCYNYWGKEDSFTIVLLNQPSDIPDYDVREIYPLEGVPKEFQIDNLYVLISGNILLCEKINSCTPPPEDGKQGTNMFELKTIKINERGECAKWDDSTVLTVLKDELGFIRCTTNPRIDRVYYYFFEPLTLHNNFSTQLHIRINAGYPNDILNQYVNRIVKINGCVTNSLSLIERINQSGYIVKYEHNILELSSITEVK